MLKQPVGQKRLTNVAVIKYRVSKKNFEIACYKNKAINWRNGIEKDLNEVLQSYAIYRNAAQGEQASADELAKFFPNEKFDDIIKTILEKGDLDIGDKERDQQKDLMFKDIANLVAEKCVHPDSKRPFSVDSIKAALQSIHFAPKLNEPVKKQASDCIKKLIEKYYIARAEMKIKFTVPLNLKKRLMNELEEMKVKPESTLDEKDSFLAICLIEPSLYRAADELIKKKLGEGTMEIITQSVMKREITDLENAGVANLMLRENPLVEETKNEGNNKSFNQNEKESKTKMKEDKEIIATQNKAQTKEIEIKSPRDSTNEVKQPSDATNEKKFKCSSCKFASFDTNQEFRTHFKTDWHNFNLKRKIEKKDPVTEDEFLDQLLDSEVSLKKY